MEKINPRFSWTRFLLFAFSLSTYAEYSDTDNDEPGYSENCTTIMVGRRASTDGSVMTSHSCDETMGRIESFFVGMFGRGF